MEANAEVAPEVELTPENWTAERSAIKKEMQNGKILHLNEVCHSVLNGP